MPSVMDAPELSEYVETHDLTIETIEQSKPRRVRRGFWRALVHKITTHLTPTSLEWHAASCSARRPFETPADLLARQHPTLYLRTFCGV